MYIIFFFCQIFGPYIFFIKKIKIPGIVPKLKHIISYTRLRIHIILIIFDVFNKYNTHMNKHLHYYLLLFFALIFSNNAFSSRQMENLGRGILVFHTNFTNVKISWRHFYNDTTTYFNVLKNGRKINWLPISDNHMETNSTLSSDRFAVISYNSYKDCLQGINGDTSATVTAWQNYTTNQKCNAAYKTIPMNVPEGGFLNGTTYSYRPNDCSVGDLDGDGEYELIVKWDPENAQDNSKSGYTGDVYLDAYKLDGTQLWRIDLGKNIRAGAHYTQFLVYDFDGDGKAEVACRTAPGSKDATGEYLSCGPAAKDNPKSDYRDSHGRVYTNPEYLTVFESDGTEGSTVTFQPARGSSSDWGDNYGNRSERFLGCVAYLDGVHPSIVMCRGYYFGKDGYNSRMELAAFDYKNKSISLKWHFKANLKKNINAKFVGQGNHNLSVADVDNDGKDEIIYGACAFNDDGTGLYSTGLGHGDAIHVSDMDPDRPGLEVWDVHEDKGSKYSSELHDAKTGEIIWGDDVNVGFDNGRGMSADIDSKSRGFEMWSYSANNIYTCKGNILFEGKRPTLNFRIYWDGDLQDELLDGTTIDKWNGSGSERLISLYKFENSSSCNGSKKTPNLCADILGDWREEVVLWNTATKNLTIFTTMTDTKYQLYTLMEDPVYRNAIAWQNVAYNQPPHLGVYIGDGIDSIPKPDIYFVGKDSTITGINKPKYNNPEISIFNYNSTIYLTAKEENILKVEIYNLAGRRISSFNNINSKSYSFEQPSIPGFIIIKIYTENGIKTLKSI